MALVRSSLHQSASSALVCISIFLQLALANPVAPPAQPTAGPLGSQTGSGQGTIPAGQNDVAGNATVATIYHAPAIKASTTILAVICACLATSTYAALISPGTRLLSTSKLPFSAIETNIGNILSAAWPDSSESSEVTPRHRPNEDGDRPDAIRLFYAGTFDDDLERVSRGVLQCKGTISPEDRLDTPPMWLTTGSILTKSMVQIAVWEWTSIWMAIAMLMATLAFNGFLTGTLATDSYPRLAIILIYALAYIVHCVYVKRKVTQFFTLLGAGASWSNLHKAGFLSVDLIQLERRLNEDATNSPTFKQVGKPAGSSLFPVASAVLLQDAGKVAAVKEENVSDVKKSESETVAGWMKRDVGTCLDAGNSALNFVITNVMAMLGITITTGFSVWTSTESSTTSQLGSMALLASLTLAVGAMFSSTVELSIVESSFRNLLMLKEVMINGEASSHVSKRAAKKRVVGFEHGTVKTVNIGSVELFKLSGFWTGLLWGPAHVLLPTKEDHSRQISGSKFEFHVSVRGNLVTFTTEKTSRHTIDNENSVDTINVCYEAPPPQTTIRAQPAKHSGKISHANVKTSPVPPTEKN